MTSARAALAVAVTLSGLRTVTAEPCPPRAALGGDGEAVARVRDELSRLGVGTGEPAPGCRAVRAQVELDREGGIAVAIVDGSRRSEGRVVSDAAVAAAWIDSWLRDDVDGVGPMPESRHTRVATADAPPPAGEPRDGAAEAGGSPLERFAIGAGYERTWSVDGAPAAGAGARACMRVGEVCVGLAAHYAREDDRAVKLTGMRRRDAALLAIASLPIAIGRMSVAPELGVGFGRRTTARLEGCAKPIVDPNCDPADPTCVKSPLCDAKTGKTYVGDQLAVATYTPRFEAALRLALPLFEHVWLEGLASVTLAPFGHSGEFAANPTPGTDPAVSSSELAIPGEPGRALQLGVSLRVGAP